MRMRFFQYITICLFLWSTSSIVAQKPYSNQTDSLTNIQAEYYFNQAHSNSDSLSNKERIRLYLKADSLYREGEDWYSGVIANMWACKLLIYEREYELLEQLSENALNITQTYLKNNNKLLGLALNNRGVFCETKSDYANSIKYYKESVKVKKTGKGSLLGISTTYFNMGFCYIEVGDYDQSINYFQKAMKIQIDSSNYNYYLLPAIKNRLGFCYSKKNQFDLAEKCYLEGLNYAKACHPKRRQVDQVILYLYQNLADLYIKKNQLDLAQKYTQLALDFQKGKAYIKDTYSYQLQGEIFLQKKKYPEALKAFQSSTKSAQLEFKDFDRHTDIGITYYKTGNVKFEQDEYEVALDLYQLALINNTSEFHSTNPTQNPSLDNTINKLNLIDILEGKAKAYVNLYKQKNNLTFLESAFNNYSLASEAIHKVRQSFNAEGSKHLLAEKVIPIYEGAIRTAFELHQKSGNKKWLEKAFHYAEENKAAALIEAIKENEALGDSNIPDSLLNKEYNLKVDIAFYEQIIHDARQKKETISIKKIDTWNDILFELKESYQNLIDHFEVNYKDYHALKFREEPINLSTIQHNLKNTALIEFFVGLENIFVFTITSDLILCKKIEKKADFEKNLYAFRKTIITIPESKTIINSQVEFCAASNQLYQTLLAPSIQELTPSIQHLTIIPDDLLACIPFSIFIDQPYQKATGSFKSLPYLYNRFGISYNYSVSLWLKHINKKTNLANKRFIGFAPEFSSYTENNQLAPLSCNVMEVEQINRLFNSENIHSEKNAHLDNFKKNVSEYQIIHLATHTFLDNQNSSFNRIYFSDTYLSQNDLYQLKLNASLAVLSACNTGSGELKKGEGVMSLSRGFTHAGCPSILMSLWSVDDCATADIMLYYYENLSEGKTKEVALQNAKKKYLDKSDDILQTHPYYWSGFVQYGNVSPIKNNNSFSWMYIVGGFCLLVCLLLVAKRK